MTSRDPMHDRLDTIQGWLRPAQAERLRHMASEVSSGGCIVEIGSYHGKSTVALAAGAPVDAMIYAIDPHAGNDRGPGEWTGAAADGEADHAAFIANLTAAGVRDRVEHVREFSQLAHEGVPGRIQLLYVDGAHGYGPALSDIEGWGGRVDPGGAMAIHDTFTSVFVTLAVVRSLFWSKQWRYRGRIRSMAFYERVPVGGFDRLRNLARQASSLPWFARNVVVRGLERIGLAPVTRLLGHRPGTGVY